ncbi:MAG: esterase [Prevotella sp.]|nr:esterase [Prevotella sp.]
MTERSIANRPCRLFGSETPEFFLVQPSARHENASLEDEVTLLEALLPRPFLLVTIELEDWTLGLMPWPDGNISRDPEAGKHGQETLDYILQGLLPELERRYGPRPVILGGYSLAGLFALWASCQTDRFPAIAAASPSVWIHGWLPFAKKNRPMAKAVYLSLGEREEHVKNQAIARVGDNLRAYYEMLRSQLDPEHCILVWEEGGHFNDNAGRLARAFAYSVSCLSFSTN